MIFDWELIRSGLTAETIGYGVMLPALWVLGLTLLADRSLGRWREHAGFATAVALALGVLSGYFALGLGPLWVRELGNKWLPHLTVLAIPAGWYAGRRTDAASVGGVMAITAVASAAPLESYSLVMQLFWAAVLGYASWVSAMSLLYARLPSALRAFAMTMTATTASLILFAAGLSRMMQIAGLLVSISMGAVVAFLMVGDRENRLVRGLVPGFSVLLTGLMFCGYLGQGAQLPPSCYALIALAPTALLVSRLPILAAKWWHGAIPAMLLLLGLLSAALTRVALLS